MQHHRQVFSFQLNRMFISPALLLALVIAASCLSGGCASTKETTAAFTPVTFESSKAIIYLYRKSRFVGAANTAEIFINEQNVCKLANGSYCAYVTEPGRIEIKALEKVSISLNLIGKLLGKQPLIEFTAEPGREYFLEFNVAGYKVKQVSKETALGLMNGLTPAKSSAE
ncbi:MAG: DUF2846 domain-containing protein [Desulfosarcinaceae bacterium]